MNLTSLCSLKIREGVREVTGAHQVVATTT